MTPAESAALLGIIASFDNRKPTVEAARAWSVVLAGVRFEDAQEAVVRHFSTSSDWLMPAHLIAEVKRIRAKRLADVVLTPPAGLTPIETNAWYAETKKRIADGEHIDTDTRGELRPRNLGDLRALTSKEEA